MKNRRPKTKNTASQSLSPHFLLLLISLSHKVPSNSQSVITLLIVPHRGFVIIKLLSHPFFFPWFQKSYINCTTRTTSPLDSFF